MAFNASRVKPVDFAHVVPPHDPTNLGVLAQSRGQYVHGAAVRSSGRDCVIVHLLAGDYYWKHAMTIPRPHARALAYLLLLETAGPLERAAVIADARAEGIEIGGITSET